MTWPVAMAQVNATKIQKRMRRPRTAAQQAADVVEHVLSGWGRRFPGDSRAPVFMVAARHGRCLLGVVCSCCSRCSFIERTGVAAAALWLADNEADGQQLQQAENDLIVLMLAIATGISS